MSHPLDKFAKVCYLVALVIGVIGVFSFGWELSDQVARRQEREKAIKAGVGRWVIDPVMGDKRFEYGFPPVRTPEAKP